MIKKGKKQGHIYQSLSNAVKQASISPETVQCNI